MASEPTYREAVSLPAGFYRVGDDGSAWTCQKKGRGAGSVGPWKRLKELPAGKGYIAVRTGFGGEVFHRYIHRRVLEAFVGPCPPGMQGCHNDGNKANNCLDNLRWDTPANNQADRIKHGTSLEGSKLPWSLLNEDAVLVLRTRAAAGETIADLAREYGVDVETARDAVRRRTWKHVG